MKDILLLKMTQDKRLAKYKKALFVTNDFPPIISGISTYFAQICSRVPRDKFVVLAPKCHNDDEYDKNQNYEVVRRWMPLSRNVWAKLLKALLNILWTLLIVKKYDISKIHCGQILSSGIAGLICKKWLHLPFVVYVYGSETVRFGNQRFSHWLLRKLTKEANLVVVNSEFTKSEYLKFGVPKLKLIKITPGVDTEIFRPGEKHQALLRRFNLDGEKVILTVSRLDERKGHRWVIESMPILLKKFPNTKYLIVGSGREEQGLKNLVNKLKLQDNIEFVGAVDEHELPDFYRLCDIFVLANSETQNDSKLKGDYEGFGIVFLEASACGKPVIGGLSGGVEDAVVPGKTGYLLPPKSTKDLISAISILIEKPNKAEYMGKQGRIRTLKEFDWHIIARKMEKILC